MPPEPRSIFHRIKYYAVEVAALIVFLAWLASSVWHEVAHLFISTVSP
jgi:hypothetical protein